MTLLGFAELRSAAYCPRQWFYDRTVGEWDVPETTHRIRALAFRYPSLRRADLDALAAEPIAVPPTQYRERLDRTARRRDRWDELVDPPARSALVVGRECRGIVHKVLADPPAPVLISTGSPPDRGVWEPQSVQAVAAAKALAWERESPVEHAFVEYPAYGVIRRVELTTRRKAAYRRTLRTIREIDGPPPRVNDRSKCEACEYVSRCGVRTRTLRSLLGSG